VNLTEARNQTLAEHSFGREEKSREEKRRAKGLFFESEKKVGLG